MLNKLSKTYCVKSFQSGGQLLMTVKKQLNVSDVEFI